MTCISRPMPESDSSSWTSSSRHAEPLMAYSEPPLRNIVRLIVTSEYSIGSAPSALSIVNETSARPSGGRPDVPAKITSSIFPPRSDLAPCSPITQASASTTLDLPEPLGPTTQVIPGSRRSVVEDAKDLKPRNVRLFKYKRPPIPSATVDGWTAPPRRPPAPRPSQHDTGRHTSKPVSDFHQCAMVERQASDSPADQRMIMEMPEQRPARPHRPAECP